jgi:hypothetical protein
MAGQGLAGTLPARDTAGMTLDNLRDYPRWPLHFSRKEHITCLQVYLIPMPPMSS